MPYETRWQNRDLIIKPDVACGASSARADLNTLYFQKAYHHMGGPPVKTGAGIVRPIIQDGKPGPQTRNAVLAFQKALKLSQTGNLDQWTWFRLDWITYNLFGDRWTPCSLNTTSMGPGGPAIRKGHNGIILSPALRVNNRGMNLHAQRGTDVCSVFLHLLLGQGRAVLRNARGTDVYSRHAKSLARDQMGDYDSDRVVEEHEKRQLRALVDYMLQRANLLGQAGYGYHGTIEVDPNDSTETTTSQVEHRGVDLLSVLVIGNLRYTDGTKMFPQFIANRDVSWSARRNTLKQLSGTVHVSPFHEHLDFGWNVPTLSPWTPVLN